jgi:hypothetical protein
MLSVFMLCYLLRVVNLSVIMLNVIMPCVVAPLINVYVLYWKRGCSFLSSPSRLSQIGELSVWKTKQLSCAVYFKHAAIIIDDSKD